MDYPNQGKKLPNGAEILVEIGKEKGVSLIAAYYPLSNHPFVVWHMNHNDKSCYWGHYFRDMKKAYECLYDKAIQHNLIRMEDYQGIEINCVKWLEEHECWETCDITDEPDMYSTYGHLKIGGVSCFSDHYSAIDCNIWANWIAMKNNMQVINAMNGNFRVQISIDNHKEK